MDFVAGAPLSQLREELKRRGIEIEPGSLAEQAVSRVSGNRGGESLMGPLTFGYVGSTPPHLVTVANNCSQGFPTKNVMKLFLFFPYYKWCDL